MTQVGSLTAAAGPRPPDTAALGRYQRRYHLRLPAATVPTCLLEDREGNAWLGTAGQGLLRHSDRALYLAPSPLSITPSKQGNRQAPPLPQVSAHPAEKGPAPWGSRGATPAAGLPGSPIITARATSPTGQWLGTAADGLYFVPNTPGLPTRHFTTAEGLLHNTITALLLDRTGRLWVGTPDTGLAVWNPTTQHFAYEKPARAGLDISCLAEDAHDNIWLGTEGQGLYVRRTGGLWQHYDAAKGITSDYTYALLVLPGPAGAAPALLLTHRQGLTLLRDASTGPTFQPLAAPDNPLVRELLPGAALNPAGTVARIPTRTGTLVLDLAAARAAAAARPPGLALATAEVDGEPRPTTNLGTLSATRHRLGFGLRGISLSPAGGPLLYQYRLRGLDDHWSRPGPATEAQFPGLGPGQYVLEARARRGDGPWSAVVTAAFGIATPFWQTWWFVLLALLGAAAGGWALLRWREGRLRRTQFVLESTVRERTAELRQQKSHIEVMNAALVVARDAADASRRAKAQFLANMSHEIRTPMNAVIGLTNLLQATHPSHEQGEYLTAIESSSQNLLVIINDILDSSKMEAGKLTLEQVPFRLPTAVRRLETMFKFATESKGLYLRVEVADNVPVAVLGDPVRLNQVLVNLVGNAIKFTRRGGVTVTAEVLGLGLADDFSATKIDPTTDPTKEANSQTQTIRFTVRDTGIGIAADKLGAIFEDFSQANTSTTREFGGTGLGLSIARSLVQLHGGELGVRSTLGEGSAFFFDLSYETRRCQRRPARCPRRTAPALRAGPAGAGGRRQRPEPAGGPQNPGSLERGSGDSRKRPPGGRSRRRRLAALRCGVYGHPNAGNGRLRSLPPNPAALPRRRAAAHHRPHRLGAARRPAAGPGRRHERYPGQAFRAGGAVCPAGPFHRPPPARPTGPGRASTLQGQRKPACSPTLPPALP